MSVSYGYGNRVVVVTGACGALGSATVEAFRKAGARVHAADVIDPDDEASLLDADHEHVTAHVTDFTDETAVSETIADVLDDEGRLDALVSVAGTWRGGDPVQETDEATLDVLVDVNVRTAFLAAKHALPHLRETEGSIVTVGSRSSLEGGEGDSLYRATKAAVRLLTESIAAENRGIVRANAILPGVIDTPQNREAMPDADHDEWVDPGAIAEVICFLCSDGAGPVSGAAVPVYGES